MGFCDAKKDFRSPVGKEEGQPPTLRSHASLPVALCPLTPPPSSTDSGA